MTVGEIVEAGNLAQSTVSHHLRILREGGFVRVQRRGTSSLVVLNETCLERFPATAPPFWAKAIHMSSGAVNVVTTSMLTRS